VPTYFQHTSSVRNGVELLNQAAPKVIGIALRLCADEIVIREGVQKLFCPRQCCKDFRSRPGDMVKVPDRIDKTEGS
jgi:hypothetical protein